jgi:hypothetical protein
MYVASIFYVPPGTIIFISNLLALDTSEFEVELFVDHVPVVMQPALARISNLEQRALTGLNQVIKYLMARSKANHVIVENNESAR